ncbi:MAG TPA: hypothetical protein ENJ20_00185 [Bacteroidetes bacterium]|nr:hypothetical protein [Bacteroidota bacterium]
MALAIIDGGSTKADWYIQANDNSSPMSLTTTGFNPNYVERDKIVAILKKEAKPLLALSPPEYIIYYGAGCKGQEQVDAVKSAFSEVFPSAQTEVHTDMLAAARATCGDTPGIVAILGTGSNSMLYDGKKEMDHVTNLGFLLGDEGSGSYIGKRLVQAWFYREMPGELHYIMEKECPNGKTDLMKNIYAGGMPAAYLASFTKKYAAHTNHPFVWNLVKDCFAEFFHRHIFKYQNYRTLPIHFVGSVAYYFKKILLEFMQEEKLQTGRILQKPIEQLYLYHLNRYTEGPMPKE